MFRFNSAYEVIEKKHIGRDQNYGDTHQSDNEDIHRHGVSRELQ